MVWNNEMPKSSGFRDRLPGPPAPAQSQKDWCRCPRCGWGWPRRSRSQSPSRFRRQLPTGWRRRWPSRPPTGCQSLKQRQGRVTPTSLIGCRITLFVHISGTHCSLFRAYLYLYHTLVPRDRKFENVVVLSGHICNSTCQNIEMGFQVWYERNPSQNLRLCSSTAEWDTGATRIRQSWTVTMTRSWRARMAININDNGAAKSLESFNKTGDNWFLK